MKDDEILILLFLYENPNSTTTDIAKNLFADKISQLDIQNSDKRKQRETERLRNEDRRVRYYLDKFVADDLVTVKLINRKKRYALNSENVHLGYARIEMVSLTMDEVSVGLGRVLLCKVKDGVIIEPVPEDATTNSNNTKLITTQK